MFPYFLLGLVLAVATYFLLRWFVAARPAQVRKVLVGVGLTLGFVAIVAAALGGRLGLASLLAPALVLLLLMRPLKRLRDSGRGPTPGQSSELRTRFLKMQLDHDSGELSGTVLEGPYAGRTLEAMAEEDLFALWRLCLAEDEQSARVLESYLDRRLGGGWQAEAGAPAGASPEAMTREEAYRILGLEPDAGPEEIRAAYRRMMRQHHPDQGGSDYLAAKINQAKALLLGD
ncbi:MAG: DnaJ domain-containing protein [Kiloniellales bacterium]|nr:DnaJ domain-containing protein [Kiloniellales bacterium]MDJ0981472.1 DnaJ domain-containing protein [Kiloniellales bacterium]